MNRNENSSLQPSESFVEQSVAVDLDELEATLPVGGYGRDDISSAIRSLLESSNKEEDLPLDMFDSISENPSAEDTLKTPLQIIDDKDPHARIATTKLNEFIAQYEIFGQQLIMLSTALDDYECPPFCATLREEITNMLGGNIQWEL